MKTITRTKIYLLIAALVLTATLAVPAAAEENQQVPFKGAFQGQDTVPCAAQALPLCTTATGTGTHLGQFKFTQGLTLNSPTTGTGSAHWVAANGDSIDTTSVVSADFSTRPLGYITVTEMHRITSGTGRFTGAQGSFTMERTHIVELSADGTHVTFGSFKGTITSPGAAH
jgi:hypothetical protein